MKIWIAQIFDNLIYVVEIGEVETRMIEAVQVFQEFPVNINKSLKATCFTVHWTNGTWFSFKKVIKVSRVDVS